MGQIQVELLTAEQWARAKELRLASLRDSAHAFGGNLETESALGESEWRANFEKLNYIVRCYCLGWWLLEFSGISRSRTLESDDEIC